MKLAFIFTLIFSLSFGFIVGESYNSRKWTPVRAKLELGYIKRLSKEEDKLIHEIEVDVQLLEYAKTINYDFLIEIISHFDSSYNETIFNKFIIEAVEYRKNNKQALLPYDADMKMDINTALHQIEQKFSKKTYE